MKDKLIGNKIIFHLFLLNILFFSYYIILAYYSRPHFDDLHFIWKLKEHSIVEYVKEFYFSTSGRFVEYFLTGVLFKIIIFTGEYRFFPILYWMLGTLICFYIMRRTFTIIPSFHSLNITFLFYNLYVLTNIDFATFNWLCAMSYYLMPPILLLTIYLVNKTEVKWIHYLILLVLSLILGGSSEAFTPVVLITMFFNGLHFFKKHNYIIAESLSDKKMQRLILSSAIILICFIIVVSAPGNYARLEGGRISEGFRQPANFHGFLCAYADAIGTFLYFIAFYFPYYAVIGLSFCWIGTIYRNKEVKILESITYKKLIIYSTIAYVFYLICSVTPNVYLYSGFGIQRNYTQVVFFTMLFICFHAFLFGFFNANYIGFHHIRRSLFAGIFILICIMIVNLSFDSVSARRYASSVDKRIEMLQEMNNQGISGIVMVDPITVPYTTDPKYLLYKLTKRKNNSQPVLYYVSDTDSIPNNYAFHLQKVYGLNFLIQLRKK